MLEGIWDDIKFENCQHWGTVWHKSIFLVSGFVLHHDADDDDGDDGDGDDVDDDDDWWHMKMNVSFIINNEESGLWMMRWDDSMIAVSFILF